MLHIYKASAGSGKTYTLTRQYLLLMLGNLNRETGKWSLKSAPDCANRHILAITFTNKATEEMIKRIITQLALLGGREEGKSPYLKDLVKTLNTDADSLRALASDVLDELLADFVYFNVSTIDSFFQNVLRIFAREIEMPDNFEIELENKYAMTVGVSEMFRSINLRGESDPIRLRERKWMESWLRQFMESRYEAGEGVNLLSRTSGLYRELVSTFTRLFSETFKIHSKEIIAYLENLENLEAFERGVKKQTEDFEVNLTVLIDKLKSYELYKYLNPIIISRIDTWIADRDFQKSKTMQKCITERYNTRSPRFIKNTPRTGEFNEFESLVDEFCVTYLKLIDLDNRNNVILKSVSPLGLLGLLLKNLDRYCKDNNLILLSETNTLLREIINCDDTPFVYERLGYYLHNFLIDEFQDTSRMQWQNIRPLILESLSHNHEDLIIGDEKQCIYRFRNSDPTLLGTQVGEDIESVYTSDLVSVEGARISENNNWRSAHEVVKFNNSIFYSLGKIIEGTDSYTNVIQQIDPERDVIPGHARLIFLPEAKKEDKKGSKTEEANNEAPGEEKSAGGSVNPSLEAMIVEIKRMLESGYKPGDICVLVRTHSEGTRALNRILDFAASEEGKPFNVEVTSNDALVLADSPAVRMVIEILRLTQIPHMVKTEITRSDGSTYISETESEAYRRTRLRYLYEYCRNSECRFADGVRKPTQSEALSLAIELLKIHTTVDEEGNFSLVENPTADSPIDITDAMREVLEFRVENLLRGASQIVDNEAPSTTLSSIVDTVIGKYLLPETIATETIFLTALQDLVYDFCNRGNSDIRTFLDYWDRGALNTNVAANDSASAINVMTIHASKGLEFPCVVIPFADWAFFEYSSQYKRRTDWFRLSADDFPEIHPSLIPPMIPVEFTAAVPKFDIFAEQAQKIKNDQRVDNLNLAYVALTRAVNELSVITCKYDSDRFGNYLRQAVAALTGENIANPEYIDPESAPWILPLSEMSRSDEAETTVVEIGEPTVIKAKTDDETECENECEEPDTTEGTQTTARPSPTVEEFILPPYNPLVNNRLSAITRLDAKFFDFDKPRHRGDLLHAIMSRVIRFNDLPRALRRMVYRAHLTPLQAQYCTDILRNVVDDPRVTHWFEGYRQVIIERPLLGKKGIRRPDRVVITADGHVDIVDYKFSDNFPELEMLLPHFPDLFSNVEQLPSAEPLATPTVEIGQDLILRTGASSRPSDNPTINSVGDPSAIVQEADNDLSTSANQLREYIKQLRRYAGMLRSSGTTAEMPIRAYLWFIPSRRLIRVTL